MTGSLRSTCERVDCFHATALPETAAIRRTFGEHHRVVEIPNGTAPVSDEELRALHMSHPCQPGSIGMLGRLHPIKAVDLVIEALAVGPPPQPIGTGGHIKFWSRAPLQSLLEKFGFREVEFIGAGRLPYLWKSMIVTAEKK